MSILKGYFLISLGYFLIFLRGVFRLAKAYFLIFLRGIYIPEGVPYKERIQITVRSNLQYRINIISL